MPMSTTQLLALYKLMLLSVSNIQSLALLKPMSLSLSSIQSLRHVVAVTVLPCKLLLSSLASCYCSLLHCNSEYCSDDFSLDKQHTRCDLQAPQQLSLPKEKALCVHSGLVLHFSMTNHAGVQPCEQTEPAAKANSITTCE